MRRFQAENLQFQYDFLLPQNEAVSDRLSVQENNCVIKLHLQNTERLRLFLLHLQEAVHWQFLYFLYHLNLTVRFLMELQSYCRIRQSGGFS